METSTAVIGLGVFGREVALSLAARGLPVIAIDSDPEMVEPLKDQVAQALILDSTVEQALIDAKIDRVRTAVNAIGTDHLQNSILTTALLSHLGVRRIIARATNDLHERILLKIGAHEVVNPEREMGRRMAQRIAMPHLNEVLHLPDGVCVAEVAAPSSFVGRTLAELGVRTRFGINVVAAKRVPLAPGGSVVGGGGAAAVSGTDTADGYRMVLNLSPTQDRLIAGDVLIVIGREDEINKLGEVSQNRQE